eukprot:gnl/TRDRNA2_/TRDRNA2_176018_c0_seq2.p1 gnl/TRDRNA2_/TRDRNA2_176018_c0~~gnl/TRDRNA2_/TRDRNA2_176018_c0_seq2.p1  ORF type:complete len:602 (+),score=97.96 gnl/TRDRNA2_/TRDRNA2_176018_c0_seq2:101-1906(+)
MSGYGGTARLRILQQQIGTQQIGTQVTSAAEASAEEDQLFKVFDSQNDLFSALQQLMEAGGDERSVTDAITGLTKYHTPSRPTDGIVRSSCTSNVPTEAAFERGIDILRQLRLKALMPNHTSKVSGDMLTYSAPEDLFRKLLLDVRERLRTVFQLSLEDAISLFPSGTDAELMPALIAYLRGLTRNGSGSEVFSVVSAAGEVGSGSFLAATGQHFAKRLPSGKTAAMAQSNHVFAPVFSGANLYMRGEDGKLLSREQQDNKVWDAVKEAAAAVGADGKQKYGCIVVHMVVGSKTGGCMPSEACMEQLVAKYGDLVLPLVDACQGRLRAGALASYLRRGYIVLASGSKFFGGPPFSGACLMSGKRASEFEQMLGNQEAIDMLKGSQLKEYVTAALMSDDLPQLRSLLPQKPLNYGCLMRWTVALYGMEMYFSEVPAGERIRILNGWTRSVRDVVKKMDSPFLSLLHDYTQDTVDNDDEQVAALSTVVSFHCRCKRGNESADHMTMDELRHVQFLMANNLTEKFPHLSLPACASTKCFIGQPVDLASSGPEKTRAKVLRVALSAPLVVRAWRTGLDAVLDEDQVVFDKMNLILEKWSLLTEQK